MGWVELIDMFCGGIIYWFSSIGRFVWGVEGFLWVVVFLVNLKRCG